MPKPISGAISRTLILLKPDAIERNLAGEILKRFERKGLKIVAAEMRWIDRELAEEHYAEHKGNVPYFKKMTDAISCGPLMAVVLEGIAAVQCSRQLIGAQSPLHHSHVGTIRADLAIEEPFNLVHGSDSDHSAKREITLWFNAATAKPSKPQISKVEEKLQLIPPDMPLIPKKKKITTNIDGIKFDEYQKQAIKFLTVSDAKELLAVSDGTKFEVPVPTKGKI